MILTADHGEALGEHGVFMHTNSVREEALRIPLVMIPYGHDSGLPKQSDNFMSLIDLAPTILDEIGLNIPNSWAGMPTQDKKERAFSFFEMDKFKGLYDHRETGILWKYWQNTRTGEEFVFNITQDSKENTNLVWEIAPERMKEWRNEINKQVHID